MFGRKHPTTDERPAHSESDCRDARIVQRINALEHTFMTAADDLNAKLDNLKHDQDRVLADLSRIKDELAAALAAGDLSGASAKVDELDAALEAASPEPVEPPPVDQPPVDEPPSS